MARARLSFAREFVHHVFQKRAGLGDERGVLGFGRSGSGTALAHSHAMNFQWRNVAQREAWSSGVGLVACLFNGAWLAACAGAPARSEDAGVDSAVDAGDAAPPQRVSALCESQSQQLQFYAARVGGEPVESGAQVLLENGQYVIVFGNCDFIAYRETGRATTGRLSDEQRERLTERFPSQLFEDHAGQHTRSGCGPSDLFSMDNVGVQAIAVCPEAEVESALATQLALDLTATLREFATEAPATGDVRYTVVREERPGSASGSSPPRPSRSRR
jgi:hypothetical protein